MTMEQVAESYCNAVLTYLSCASDKTVLTDIRLLLIDNQTTNQVRKYFTTHFFNQQKESLVASSYGGAQQPIAVYNYSGSQQPQQPIAACNHEGSQHPQQPIAVHSYGGRPSTDADAGVVICVICLDTVVNPKRLSCNHVFCKGCIEEQFKHQRKCPICGKLFGIQRGNQPDGKMESKEIKTDLPGYRGCGTIVITYTIYSGIQQVNRIMHYVFQNYQFN